MDSRQELEELRRLDELEMKAAGTKKPAASKPTVYDPTEGMSTMAKLGAGFDTGLMRGVRGSLNAADALGRAMPQNALRETMLRRAGVPVEHNVPEFAQTPQIQEADKLADPLMRTGAGLVGGIGGEVAATAPAGVVGKSVSAAQGAARAVPVLGRALAARMVPSMAEGSVQAAVTGDPEERLKNAGEGAVWGAGGHYLGRALKRLWGGLVKKSAEAELMETIAQQHGTDLKLPLSQAASDEGISGILKTIYGKVLPLIPGSAGKLGKQEAESASKFREIALKEAAPEGATLLPNAGDEVHSTVEHIGQAFDNAYTNTIKSYAFNAPKAGAFKSTITGNMPNVPAGTLDEISEAADKIMAKYTKNGVLDGADLMRAKNDLTRLASRADDDAAAAYEAAQGHLDDLVRTELRQGNKASNLKDLETYEGLQEPWKKFQRVVRAAARTGETGGKFGAKDLKNSVRSMSDEKIVAQGKAPLQDLSEVGQETVGKGARYPGFVEKTLAWGGLGGLGLLGSPAGAAGLYFAGKAAGSPRTQKALLGEYGMQQALINALRNNPDAARYLGSGLRGAAIAENQDAP